MSKKLVGFDIESYLITNQVAPKPVCVSFWYDDENRGEVLLVKDAINPLKQLLQDDYVTLVATNTQFDLISLALYDKSLMFSIEKAFSEGRILCTRLAELLLNTADPEEKGEDNPQVFKYDDQGNMKKIGGASSLAGSVYKYLDEDITSSKEGDSVRYKYKELDEIPVKQWSEEAVEYSIQDSKYSCLVLKEQGKRARELKEKIGVNVLTDLSRQTYVSYILNYMATGIGVGVNTDLNKDVKDGLQEEHDEQIKPAVEHGVFIPSSSNKRGFTLKKDKLREVLKEIAKFTGVDYPRTDKGDDIKTDKDAFFKAQDSIELCLRTGRSMHTKLKLTDSQKEHLVHLSSILRSVQDSNKTYKQMNDFLKALSNARLNTDSRLRYSYSSLKRTGRTSCHNPNLQQLPRSTNVRKCITPREDHVFIIADYSNAELRTLAQAHINEGRESNLAREYQKDPNFDPHLYSAIQMMKEKKVDMEEGKAILKDKKHPLHPRLKELRQLSKIANFGYAGGLTPNRFIDYAQGYGVKLTLEQATKLHQDWLDVWSEMKEYFKVRTSLCDVASREYDPYKAVQHFPTVKRARFLDRFTVACNTVFQGIASDGAKEGLILIWKDCFFNQASPLFGSYPILFIHDEVILEHPYKSKEKATRGAYRLKELMEQGMEKHTPNIPAIAEPCLSMVWTKDAYSEVDQKGMLETYRI
tara:strand:- start:1015 stop:3105 length:2091 start_codon:yes stop_codon:yes gene_type:complete